MNMEYKNPWADSTSSPVYKRLDCKVYKSKCGRGNIVKVSDRQFDYLLDGKCVTQRAGKSMDYLDKLIQHILHNKQSDDCWLIRAKRFFESQ